MPRGQRSSDSLRIIAPGGVSPGKRTRPRIEPVSAAKARRKLITQNHKAVAPECLSRGPIVSCDGDLVDPRLRPAGMTERMHRESRVLRSAFTLFRSFFNVLPSSEVSGDE